MLCYNKGMINILSNFGININLFKILVKIGNIIF